MSRFSGALQLTDRSYFLFLSDCSGDFGAGEDMFFKSAILLLYPNAIPNEATISNIGN